MVFLSHGPFERGELGGCASTASSLMCRRNPETNPYFGPLQMRYMDVVFECDYYILANKGYLLLFPIAIFNSSESFPVVSLILVFIQGNIDFPCPMDRIAAAAVRLRPPKKGSESRKAET